MRIGLITIGSLEAGSTRFRFGQFLSLWKEKGCEVDLIHKDSFLSLSEPAQASFCSSCDVVINQKCLFPHAVLHLIRAHSAFLIFDFDDAITTRFDRPYSMWTAWKLQRRFSATLKSADLCLCANEELFRMAKPYARRIEIVPMAVVIPQSMPCKQNTKIRFGWIGAPGNLLFLNALLPKLARVLKHNGAEFHLLSGKRPRFDFDFFYHPFSLEAEENLLLSLDIGLLPLPQADAFVAAKSPIKALSYMSHGVTVIGNAPGATKEILNETRAKIVENWEDDLHELINNPQLRLCLAKNAFAFVREKHNTETIGVRLLELIQKTAAF